MKIQPVIIVILVLVIIWLALCNRRVIEKPTVITVKEQKEIIKKDEAYTKHIVDSINFNIVDPALADADFWETQYRKEYLNGIEQASVFNDYLNTHNFTDSSGKVRESFESYVSTANKTKAACDSTLLAKNRVISGKDALIVAKDTLINRKTAALQVAFEQQGNLTSYIKKMQLHHSVYAGATAIGGGSSASSGAGVNLGYRTKNGTMIEAGTMHTNNFKTTQFTFGIKKTIFSF